MQSKSPTLSEWGSHPRLAGGIEEDILADKCRRWTTEVKVEG